MLVASFRLDPDAVALRETFERLPDLTLEVERIAAHGTESTMPCLWTSGVDFDVLDEALAERDYSFALLDLAEPDAPRRWRGDLTAAQREALVVANERGYFDVPRAVTTRELAAELAVSHQALSERLRRATGNLVESSLASPEDAS